MKIRMKYAKDSLRQKFDQLLKEHLQVITDMMEKLDEAREELNIIVSEKFQEPLPLSKARFLQVNFLKLQLFLVIVRFYNFFIFFIKRKTRRAEIKITNSQTASRCER